MRKARKILHAYKVFHPDVDGGIPSAIATLCSSTNPDFNHSVLVARLQGFARNYQSSGIPVEAVASLGTVFSSPIAPTYPAAFLRRANASDIVVHHAPFPLTDMVAPRLARHVALIVYWHADIISYSLLKRFFRYSIQRTLERADRIIVSDRSMISGSTELNSVEAKCSVVPYGADLDFWSTCSPAEKASAEALRQKHPRMILAIGRLVPYKGFDSLLRALAGTDGEAVIIGEGPLLGELKTLAGQLGLANRVTFTGRLLPGEVKSYLYAAKVLAFPSSTRAEAFGLVQLEAMTAGLPIVNTSLPTAVPKIARHQCEALTVEPNDPVALGKALQILLDDRALASRLGQAGKARALSEYSQAVYLSRIEQIYTELLDARARASSQDL